MERCGTLTAVYLGVSLQVLLAVILPFILLVYLMKKKLLSWKSLLMGILIFIVFSQIFEKILHVLVLAPNGVELKSSSNPYLFALYGGLAAGVFEEMGRYIAFKLFLKNNRHYKDGLSYGLGHGGIEAIFIGGMSALSSLLIASLVQSGNLQKVMGSVLPDDQITALSEQFEHASFWLFAAGGFERSFALALHIALSILVLYAIRKQKFVYVLYAILIHAAINFFPALYQAGTITNLLLIEIFLGIIAIVSVVFVVKMKPKFEE